MKITINRIDDNFLMEAKNEIGNTVRIDSKLSEKPAGASPMELLLMGIGGCSAIDIVSILQKKRLHIESYKAEVNGERQQGVVPALFTDISVAIFLEGDIPKEAALQAAELSFGKYCSVSKTLEKTAAISYTVFLNQEKLITAHV